MTWGHYVLLQWKKINHKQKKRTCGYIYTNIWKTQKYGKLFKNIDQPGQPIHLHTHTLSFPTHRFPPTSSLSLVPSLIFTYKCWGMIWTQYIYNGGWGYLFWKKKEPILSFPFPMRQEKCSSFRSKPFSTRMIWKSVSPSTSCFPALSSSLPAYNLSVITYRVISPTRAMGVYPWASSYWKGGSVRVSELLYIP